MAALDAIVGYLPHMRRNGEDDVFCEIVGGTVTFLNRSWEDDREEFIREGLDMLIVLAKRWSELLMDNDLCKCLMVIVGKENVESETLTKAIDLMLVFAKKGESSRDDLAVRLDQLSAQFFHHLKVFKDVIEEEPESYHIGREGLVSVATV
ncbi:hypothetical protein Tco_1499951 [Tanacetum coccineum]